MIKKTFERVNEDVYYEKLSNGLEVFLYPNNKTKNFYISISVKYGARVTKYQKDNKIYSITPGSAHFLEHKVMALSENEEISKRINELGSLANAWTNYKGTNYNLFGSINLKENLKLLLDIFYHIDINDKCVEEEKGIIGEEIDMYKDQIDSYMYSSLYKNIFNNSYAKNTVIGERNDIEKITAKELNRIYNDFYIPNNTFIIVCGHFDEEEIMNQIKEYISNLKLKEKQIPKRIIEKETDNVRVEYEEIKRDMVDVRVKYALKIKRKLFNIKNDTLLRYYLDIILSDNFTATSSLYEKYKNEGIINNMSTSIHVIDDYVALTISAFCKDGNKFIDNIKKDIKKMTITKEGFERNKKLFLKSYIVDFDNIEDVEYNICESVISDNEVNYDEYSEIVNMNYDKAKELLSQITYNNYSILRTIR